MIVKVRARVDVWSPSTQRLPRRNGIRSASMSMLPLGRANSNPQRYPKRGRSMIRAAFCFRVLIYCWAIDSLHASF